MELLVVIVIIAILAGLLIPAIGAAIKTARNAAVSAEINQLSQALADFKSKYGDYPPSRMLLCENGNWDTTSTAAVPVPGVAGEADITYGRLAQRSLSYMRKFWPKVATSTSGPIYTTSSGWLDFNGNGTLDTPYVLQGHECLTFFLGGIPTTGGMSGFAKNPNNPFQNSTIAPNRQPPLFEFDSGRLDFAGSAHGIPGYFDSFKTNRHYAYFSGYGGNAYDPNDCSFAATESDANTTSPLLLRYQVTFPIGSGATASTTAISAPPNPYTATVTDPAAETPPLGGGVTFQKANTFQILSAGGDGEFGIGGQFAPSGTTPLPLDPAPSAVYNSTDAGLRNPERDNITNFHQSRLD